MFYFEKFNFGEILKSDLLDSAFFTTRTTCIRSQEYEMQQKIAENYSQIKNYLGVEKLISPTQTHSTNIELVRYEKEDYPEVDAFILTDKRVGIFLNFADCTPIILYDSTKNIGAIAHAGWRGTAGKIVQKTVRYMVENYDCEPSDIVALIGPCIDKCCFEVGEDVFEKLYSTVGLDGLNDKTFADLKEINRLQLMQVGVQRIDICPYCTVCDNDKFFSYRKENGITSRHSAILKLN